MMNDHAFYCVTTAGGGSVRVWVEKRDIKDYGEREAVAHAAWRKLFDSNKDAFGNEMRGKDRNNAGQMLKQLCDKMGVDKVKRQFTAAIKYEETST